MAIDIRNQRGEDVSLMEQNMSLPQNNPMMGLS
jgi:hypothetical protein